MTRTVLILGASGKFGSAAAEAFWNAGWQVRHHDRTTGNLLEDARGVEVVVNGWNPPGYRNWDRLVPKITARAIQAARVSGATLIVPGNVYVYGEGAPELLTKDTPHRATNPMGRVRIESERTYRRSGVQTIVVRAGDFITPEPGGAWFDTVIAARARKGRVTWPGPVDVPHAFAWVPDMARVAQMLAEQRQTLGPFTEVGLPGFTLTGQQMAGAIGRVMGRKMRLARFPWALMRPLKPFVSLLPGLFEMRYLWSMPHRIDGNRLARLLPDFHPTPLDEALSVALNLKVHPDQPVGRGGLVAAAQ